jgi:hypothetical protein
MQDNSVYTEIINTSHTLYLHVTKTVPIDFEHVVPELKFDH